MSDLWDELNTWHLDLSITADALDHVLMAIEEPVGLSATAYILRRRLSDLVESFPFPDPFPYCVMPGEDICLADIDDGLTADLDGVPAELLTGGRDD